MLTQSHSEQCHFSYECLKTLSKGNCVLMLFQMSFLRGFLQSHFIKQKAWSELLQVAFVIGTCTRSPSEASWWNEILNRRRITLWNITQTPCLLLAFVSEYTFIYISESLINYQRHALLGKGNYSSQSVLQHETDGTRSSPTRYPRIKMGGGR